MKRTLISAAVAALAFSAPSYAEDGNQLYQATVNSNVRAAPTTNSQRIGFLPEGSRVRVIGDAAGGNWHQIRLDSGQMGFVYGPLLRAVEEAGSSAAASGSSTLKGGPTPAPEDAFAYIIWPQNGEVIPARDAFIGG